MDKKKSPDRLTGVGADECGTRIPVSSAMSVSQLNDARQPAFDFVEALESIVHHRMIGRPIELTPFAGAYGLAGYVLTVNGSSVRVIFTVIVGYNEQHTHFTLIRATGRTRQVHEKSAIARAATSLLSNLRLPLHAGANMPQAMTIGTMDGDK